jgi:transposase
VSRASRSCAGERASRRTSYRWRKDFLEAGKKQLAGDTVRAATGDDTARVLVEEIEIDVEP